MKKIISLVAIVVLAVVTAITVRASTANAAKSPTYTTTWERCDGTVKYAFDYGATTGGDQFASSVWYMATHQHEANPVFLVSYMVNSVASGTVYHPELCN